MRLTFLNRNGEVVEKQLKDIGATWYGINKVRAKSLSKEESEFLKKYGLKSTIFNVANLRTYSHVHLPSYYIGVVLAHGAKDMRGVKE